RRDRRPGPGGTDRHRREGLRARVADHRSPGRSSLTLLAVGDQVVTTHLLAGDLPGYVERREAGLVRDLAVPELVGSLVGLECSLEVALFAEQSCQIERAVGVATIIRAPEARLGRRPVAVAFEQQPEV